MRKFFVAAAIAVASLIGSASSADAAYLFRVRIEATAGAGAGTGVVIDDNGAGDGNGALGGLSWTGSLGGASFTLTSGSSQPPAFVDSDVYSAIKLGVIIDSAAAGSAFRITLERGGFNTGPDGPLQLTGSIGGVVPNLSTISYNTWANGSDAVPALGATTGATPAVLGAIGGVPSGSVSAWNSNFTYTNPAGPGGNSFDSESSAGFTKSGDYSLFSQALFTFGTTGGASIDATTTVTPLPASLIMALSGLPAIGLGAWARRRRVIAMA